MALGELARKCQIGTAVMSRIERGREIPDDSVLSNIGEALGWTAGEVRASLPSKEEADKDADRFSDMLTALAAAKDDAKAKGFKRGNAGRDDIECPICKGRLYYTVVASNGHMWGKCATEGCVSWME